MLIGYIYFFPINVDCALILEIGYSPQK